MTYQELLDGLQKLSPEQLSLDVAILFFDEYTSEEDESEVFDPLYPVLIVETCKP